MISCAVDAWPQKNVCITDLTAAAHPAFESSNRTRDLRKAREHATVTTSRIDDTIAYGFARRYVDHMDELDADPRWRLHRDTFLVLAACDVDAWCVTVQTADAGAGASVIYVVANTTAVYLYGTRWGRPHGEPTLAHVEMHGHLAALGVTDAVLGGGVTDAADDSLLAFKRTLGSREQPLHLAARAFDADAHDDAVGRGLLRSLPAKAVLQ